MAGSYPRAFAPSLPVGYWNFPSADRDTSAYLSRTAFLIPCRSGGDFGENVPVTSERQLPAPPDGGQAGAAMFFSNWSVMLPLLTPSPVPGPRSGHRHARCPRTAAGGCRSR
jgi:hypothetical protein